MQTSSGERRLRGQELIEPIIRIPTLGAKQLIELDELYRNTRETRLRRRAQIVLLPPSSPDLCGHRRGSPLQRGDVALLVKALPRRRIEGLRSVPPLACRAR